MVPRRYNQSQQKAHDSSISDYKMGGISLNLNTSLPQIKNQLERKKFSMPPVKS